MPRRSWSAVGGEEVSPALLLGSVGQHVAVHAPCSVAVVRGQKDVRNGPVVAGVHGGGATAAALATAFGMAEEPLRR